MKITIEASEVRELLRAGVISPDAGQALATRFGENYDEEANLADSIAAKRLLVERLSQDVAVLEARAAAARPVLEAQGVIDNAARLWIAVERAMRAHTATLDGEDGGPPATRDDVAKTEGELLRAITALGNQLGEEGGEEDDPPC